MRSWYDWITRNKPSPVFYKIFFSYFSIVILILAVISFMIYSTFVETLKQNVDSVSKNDLLQFSRLMDNELRAMERIALQVAANPKLVPFFATRDTAGALDALGELKKYNSYQSSIVQDLMVYYDRDPQHLLAASGKYRLSAGSDGSEEGATTERSMQRLLQSVRGPALLPWRSPLAPAGSDAVLAYVYPLPATSLGPYAMMIFALDSEKIHQRMANVANLYQARIHIFDSNGERLIDSPPEFDEQPPIAELLGKPQGRTVSRLKIAGNPYSVIQLQSEYNGWRYAMVVSSEPFMRQLNNQITVFNYSVILLLLLGLVFAVVFTINNYKPLRKLIERFDKNTPLPVAGKPANEITYLGYLFERVSSQNDTLRSELRSKKALVRDQLLIQLLSGKVKDLSELQQQEEYTGLTLGKPCFTVLYFIIDDYSHFTATNSAATQELLKFGLLNVIEELAGELGSGFGLNFLEDKGGILLLNTDGGVARRDIEQMAWRAKAFFKKHYRFTITIGVGGTCTGLKGIAGSFQEASQAAGFRFIQGGDRMIFYEDIPEAEIRRGIYPFELEEQLVTAMKQGQVQAVREVIHELFERIRLNTLSVDIAQNMCMGFVYSLSRTVKELTPLSDLSIEHDIQQLLLDRFETMEQLKSGIMELCMRVCQMLDEARNRNFDELQDRVIDYVSAHYTDCALSLDQIADYIGLSPSYLTRCFKSNTGQTLMSYVDTLRMATAKQLLEQTDAPLREVLQQSGYSDETNFIRKFKKLEGTTPKRYRLNRKISRRKEKENIE